MQIDEFNNEYIEVDNDEIIRLLLEFPNLIKNQFIINRLKLMIEQNIYN